LKAVILKKTHRIKS